MISAYFRNKKKRIFLDVVLFMVFALCFWLTDTPLAAIWYPAVLYGTIILFYVLWDYRKFYHKHLHLEKVKHHIDETAENLPEAMDLLEEDYQNLILAVLETKAQNIREIKGKLEGNKEYITLWAHQIKTPITAMELLLQEVDEDNFEEKCRELKTKLFEVEQYVDSSLQYMRLDTMTADLELKEYALFDIVKKAVKYYSKTFIAKRLSLKMSAAEVPVVTDEKWLLFVVKQLLSNALKYTKTGSISIYMHPQKEKVLVIEDTGIGIAPENLPRIYDRGFTGYNGRMQEKATGIGLYLSKRILDQLGHGILITSKEGEGTKVEVLFCQTEVDSAY